MGAGGYSNAEDAAAPAQSWANVVKSDSTTYQPKPKALYVGGAGDVVLQDTQGNSATFACVAGQILPMRPYKIMSTNTTATGIVALY